VTNILSLNKESFVQKFLTPISKLADNVSISFNDDEVFTTCASPDGSIVLLASYKTDTAVKGIPRINLPDVKKFVRLLDCVDQDNIALTIENNHLKYVTPSFKFNYFLLEDSYMQRCPVNPEKIKQLKYDTAFLLPNIKFNEVLKGSSIATDSDKLYFYTKDGKVYCELNDLERQNINNITYLVADKFVGDNIKNTLPLNLENIRLLAGTKCNEFTVKVNNELKVTLFQIEEKDIDIKFIISALVK
jgi:DNA polymerase III sliding clamp (beta) subunit (PCNA family)